jgi:hypothetical protein
MVLVHEKDSGKTKQTKKTRRQAANIRSRRLPAENHRTRTSVENLDRWLSCAQVEKSTSDKGKNAVDR